jgi:hypothetical protein
MGKKPTGTADNIHKGFLALNNTVHPGNRELNQQDTIDTVHEGFQYRMGSTCRE